MTAHDYVKAYRAREDRAWENVETLFETLAEIEVGCDKSSREGERVFTSKEFDKFVKDELEL